MRLRFTIRDLLWLTALIAMGVGWWLEHRAQRSQLLDALARQAELAIENERLRSTVQEIRREYDTRKNGSWYIGPIPDNSR
jgi:hypothetical protein